MVPINPCSGCKAPCCTEHVITVTSFDMLRIAENTGKKPFEFSLLAPATLLNLNDALVLECYEGKLRYDYVLALRSHPCIFLNNNRCTIHTIAPYVCRSYPYTSRGTMLRNSRCNPLRSFLFSLTGVSIRSEEYSSQMNRYVELVKKWNSKKGTKEECMQFLINESKG